MKLSSYEDNCIIILLTGLLIPALREATFRVSQRVLNVSSSCVCGRLHVATVCVKILKTDALHVGCFEICIHIRLCRKKLLPQYFYFSKN